ncbi:hypothetical protein Pcinc_014460 [Petrolisthes cinctipes]|uniref:Uncharacterized protein n=1 Tax=Petrolisthes cinctipes TaxID=88211 RepID=A0AAE1KQP1_PETCI|nr:hypothetical protein Pcinc_014460 [Petrolisthes cinctipes]
MGNQSSRGALTQPPPNWTQSFPRENKRLRKYGATADTKVLPQRIPGQRLRPTENGLHLQTKGTISGRRISEFQVPHHPAFPPPMSLHQPHSASMTALHFPQYPDERVASMHDLRFGRPPPKTYASEPDLRGPSPPTAVSPPPHTIISQSPTKGRIKSKKKYKAPPVPNSGPHDTQSLPRSVERSHSVGSMIPHQHHQQPAPWGVHFAEQPVQSPPRKQKSRKIGLFRKKNESRRPEQEQQMSPREAKKGKKRIMVEDKRVVVSAMRYSPREELRERARSLDCLQHELRHPPVSPVPIAATSLTHLDQPHETRLWATLDRESRRSVRQEVDPKRSSTIERESRRSYKENRTTSSSTLERDVQKSHRRMSTLERKVEERKHSQEVRDNSTPSSGRHVSRLDSYRDNSSHHRTSSSGSHHELIPEEVERHGEEWKRGENKQVDNEKSAMKRNVDDDWEKAENQVTQRKKMNANLQAELLQTVNNLKKAPTEEKPTTLTRKNRESERKPNASPATPSSQKEVAEESEAQPKTKTFFFGMEPQQPSRDSHSAANSGLHKIKNQEEAAKSRNQEEVHINGLTVEYTRRTLERNDKSRSRSRTANKVIQRSTDQLDEPDGRTAAKYNDPQRLSKDVEDFAVAIERRKLRQYDGESGGSGSSRREDGGYHSRQNSGSLYLENEGEGSDQNELSMNLRPTLPRRQLEIPRFSPNAAWRSLSLERASKEPEHLDETHSSEGPDSVFEARIQRFTRPTAPPRGSGEKSADSGISGDAGSPGPNHEFEAMIPTEKSKSSSGPLAVSSPVASGRVEGRRTWTPAQDLDDNSLDSNGDQTVLPAGLSTPPKLTSRSNMFSKPKDIPQEPEDEDDSPIETEPVSELISQEKKDLWRRRKRNGTESVPQKFNSLRRLKRSMSGAMSGMGRKSPEDYDRSRTPDEPRTQPPDDSNWRDNWSMSRSIPNSLNTCEEQETASNLSSCRNFRSRSESRVGPGGGTVGAEGTQEDPRSRTPSYLQYNNGGHIMYLPEYNSRRMSRGEGDSEDESDRRYQRLSVHPDSPDNERKPPSGDENPVSPERYHGAPSSSSPMQLHPLHLLHVPPNSRKLKGKKFSYQSTVRVLEKRKLEEKLSREVAEKEMQRLKEMEAMKKVEEEFQRKREREKKKVKQQLKLFQMQQQKQQHCQQSPHQQQQHVGRESHNSSYSSDDHALSSYSSEHQEASSQASSPPPPLPVSSPPQVREIFPPFTSLPAELPSESSPGFISGIKSWVRCRKESRSSNSSTTITSSAPRQEPDGAPASSPRKTSGDDFSSSSGTASPSSDPKTHKQHNMRAEIIAASRKRSGNQFLNTTHQQQHHHLQQQHRASGRSINSNTNHQLRKYDHTEETTQQQQQQQQQQQHLQETRPDQEHEANYHHQQQQQQRRHHNNNNNSNKHLKHVKQRDDFRRSQSPDGRRLGSVPLFQELSELHQERREYREYRSPSRHSHSPPVRTHNGPPAPIAPGKTSNYRRDFCRGNAQVIGLNLVTTKPNRADDSDKHSKHSSEGRRSAGAGSSNSVGLGGRSSSLDLLDTPSPRPHHRHHHHAHTSNSNTPPPPPPPPPLPSHPPHDTNLARMSPPVDSSPARFARSILTPFNPVKGYRPVNFSPPPPTKILHVN